MRAHLYRLAFLAPLLLAACAEIDPAELRAQDEASCADAGFVLGSESYKLCLMLQDHNRRLAQIESRLGFIELDTHRLDTLRPYYVRP